MGVAGDTVVADAALEDEEAGASPSSSSSPSGGPSAATPAGAAARAAGAARAAAAALAGADRVLLAIVGLGAILRFYGLGTQSLWYDEALTADATAHDLHFVFQHVVAFEGSAPPYFLGMWAWTQVFGRSPESLRFLPALAGVVTVPVIYAALRTLGQQVRVARVAALLVAVNPMLVWYSQEARQYSLVALGSALMLWAYALIRDDPSRRSSWWLWAGTAAVTSALHYLAVALIVAFAALLYLQVPERRRQLARACVPTVVTLATLLPFALRQRSKPGYPDWVSSLPLDYRLNNAVKSALVGPGSPDDRLWLVVLAAVAVAGLALVVRVRQHERNAAALLAGLGAFVLIGALIATVVGIDAVLARYLIAGLVPLIAAVAVGLGSPKAGWVGLVTVGVVCVTSVFVVGRVATDTALHKPDWREVASVVDPSVGEPIPDGGSRLMMLHWTTYGVQPLIDEVDEAERLSGDTARDVVEIDVIWLNYEDVACDMLVGRVCNMLFVGGDPPEPIASQMTLVDTFVLDQFTIERWRFSQPTTVDADELMPDRRKGSILVIEE